MTSKMTEALADVRSLRARIAARWPVTDRDARRPAAVLLVEDDEDLRRVYRCDLERCGLEVHEVTTLHAASRLAPAAALVVLDLGLPDAKPTEVLAWAAEMGRPVILASGNPLAESSGLPCWPKIGAVSGLRDLVFDVLRARVRSAVGA